MKRLLRHSIALLICSVMASIANAEELKPYRTRTGRIVVPKPITVNIESATDLLDVKVPYAPKSYDLDRFFLFRHLSGMPINIVSTTDEVSESTIAFRRSEGYSPLSGSLLKENHETPNECLKRIAEQSMTKWGYAFFLTEKTMTFYPKKDFTNHFINTTQIPRIEIENFSFNQILMNPAIDAICKENDIRNSPPLQTIIGSHFDPKACNKYAYEFHFTFEGGSLLDYLVRVCEECTSKIPDCFVRFRCNQYSGEMTKLGKGQIVMHLADKNDSLKKLSIYNPKEER